MSSHAQTRMLKELIIKSTPDNIYQVEEFIEEVRDELDFKDDVYGNVMVAITEAVNNSIIHGNKGDSSKNVKIQCSTSNPYRLMVAVEDEGDGFDPDTLPDPTAPENLANPGGRGVFLMRNLSDDISFTNDGKRVEMIFNIWWIWFSFFAKRSPTN